MSRSLRGSVSRYVIRSVIRSVSRSVGGSVGGSVSRFVSGSVSGSVSRSVRGPLIMRGTATHYLLEQAGQRAGICLLTA